MQLVNDAIKIEACFILGIMCERNFLACVIKVKPVFAPLIGATTFRACKIQVPQFTELASCNISPYVHQMVNVTPPLKSEIL